MRCVMIAFILSITLGCVATSPPKPNTSISFELFPGTPGKPGFESHELPVYASPGKEVEVAFKAKKPIHAGVSGGTHFGILAEGTGANITVRFEMIKLGEVRIYISSVDGSAERVEATVSGGSFPTGADHWYFQKREVPIQSIQHNAGSRPSSSDSPASATPSTPAPRG